MRFEVFSARLFDEEATYDKYREALAKVGKVSYFCECDTGNPVIELKLDDLDALPSLINELGRDIKISTPYNEKKPFQLWIVDGYMEWGEIVAIKLELKNPAEIMDEDE